MLHELAGALAVKWAVAIVASLCAGDGPSLDCTIDIEDKKASSECHRNGFCASSECCYSEVTIPPHHILTRGDKRILSFEKVSGAFIFRKCDPPVVILGLVFGTWTCETEFTRPIPGYFLYTLAPCPERKDLKSSSGAGENGSPE